WTHEREWRWPYRGDIKNFLNHIKEYGIPENIESTPGFDFRSSALYTGALVTTFNGSYLCPILIPEKIAIGMEIRYHIIESTIPA
ncbi:hypothetical protein MJL33_32330, partial [Salmonella enterica subsp. enterica serovar Kentucky]|nr:hypothetical protein [Salmonella enterica subsp. enterica serovar Kentucky]